MIVVILRQLIKVIYLGLIIVILNWNKKMDDDRDFKARIDKTAKNYRLLKRADVF